MSDKIDDPDLFVQLLDRHVAGVNRLAVALDLQESRYNQSNSQQDARRVLAICHELNSEIAYGRYLMEQHP